LAYCTASWTPLIASTQFRRFYSAVHHCRNASSFVTASAISFLVFGFSPSSVLYIHKVFHFIWFWCGPSLLRATFINRYRSCSCYRFWRDVNKKVIMAIQTSIHCIWIFSSVRLLTSIQPQLKTRRTFDSCECTCSMYNDCAIFWRNRGLIFIFYSERIHLNVISSSASTVIIFFMSQFTFRFLRTIFRQYVAFCFIILCILQLWRHIDIVVVCKWDTGTMQLFKRINYRLQNHLERKDETQFRWKFTSWLMQNHVVKISFTLHSLKLK